MYKDPKETLTAQGTAITNLTTRVLRTPEDIERQIRDLRMLTNSADRITRLGKFLETGLDGFTVADFVDWISEDLLMAMLSDVYEQKCQQIKREGVVLPAVKTCHGESVTVAKPGFFFLKDGSCYISAAEISKSHVRVGTVEFEAKRLDDGWTFQGVALRDRVQQSTDQCSAEAPRHQGPIDRLPAPGEVWAHYKGGEYTIECVAHDEGDVNWLMVVYRGMDGRTWVRPLAEFIGLTEEGGIKRFRLVAEAKHNG